MLNLARFSSPSPRQRESSWIEYRLLKMARVIRARRGSATSPLSSALRGMNPQHTVAKTIASNSGAYSRSNGQLMKTDFAGSRDNSPWPKRGRLAELGVTFRDQPAFQNPIRILSEAWQPGQSPASARSAQPVCRGPPRSKTSVRRNCSASATRRIHFDGSVPGSTLRGTQFRRKGGGSAAPRCRALRELATGFRQEALCLSRMK
jgi:hypothetical protein